jgi:hypothetical protein
MSAWQVVLQRMSARQVVSQQVSAWQVVLQRMSARQVVSQQVSAWQAVSVIALLQLEAC